MNLKNILTAVSDALAIWKTIQKRRAARAEARTASELDKIRTEAGTKSPSER